MIKLVCVFSDDRRLLLLIYWLQRYRTRGIWDDCGDKTDGTYDSRVHNKWLNLFVFQRWGQAPMVEVFSHPCTGDLHRQAGGDKVQPWLSGQNMWAWHLAFWAVLSVQSLVLNYGRHCCVGLYRCSYKPAITWGGVPFKPITAMHALISLSLYTLNLVVHTSTF